MRTSTRARKYLVQSLFFILVCLFLFNTSLASITTETIQYSYDKASQLINAANSDGKQYSYQFDENGNRTLMVTAQSGGKVNHPPNIPNTPIPADGGTGLGIYDLNLSWSGGDIDGDSVTYTLYFGTSPTNMQQRWSGSQASYTISYLTENTSYYWKVYAKDSHDSITEGPVWSFMTSADPVYPDGHLLSEHVVINVTNSAEFQAALTTAAQSESTSPYVIQLAEGVYKISDNNNSPFEYHSCKYNSIIIKGSSDPSKTILDGENKATFTDSGSVLDISVGCEGSRVEGIYVSGLTITNGNGLNGGISIGGTANSVKLTNCIIYNNTAVFEGGGACINGNTSNIEIKDNEFYSNSAGGGGGLDLKGTSNNIKLINNKIHNNIAQVGYSQPQGGGIYISNGQSNCLFINNTINNNSSSQEGGGIYIDNQQGSITSMVNNIIYNNSSLSNGGGIFATNSSDVGYDTSQLTLTNNTILKNTGVKGGGLYLYNHFAFQNTKNVEEEGRFYFAKNTGEGRIYLCDDQLSGTVTNLYNNIIWDNYATEGGDVYNVTGYNDSILNLSRNDLGNIAGLDRGDNLDIDPSVYSEDNGDCHLRESSGLIDAGDNSAPLLPACDFDGNARIAGLAVDIGAYEAQPQDAEPPISTITSPSDGAYSSCVIIISGTARYYGRGIKKIEVSTDGGTTWKTATGTTSWSYKWAPLVDGTYILKSRATDFDGNVEYPVTYKTINYANPNSFDYSCSPKAMTSLPYQDTADTGSATKSDYDPLTSIPYGHNVWYSYTPSNTEYLIINTLGSDFKNIVGIYTGLCNDLNEVLTSNSGDGYNSIVGFPATAGVTYKVMVGSQGDSDGGHLVLNVIGKTSYSQITFPTDGSVITNPISQITGKAFDCSGSGILRVELCINGGPWTSAGDSLGDGTWSSWALSNPAIRYGMNTIKFRALNNASYIESPENLINFTYNFDNTPPHSGISSPANGSLLKDVDTVTISGISDDGIGSGVSLVEISIDDGAWTQVNSTANGWSTWTYNWNSAPIGVHTIKCRATDNSGNIETTGVATTITVAKSGVLAWGYNGYGQLGDGTTNSTNEPEFIQTDPDVPTSQGTITKISGGYGHTVALKSDGTVWAWGANGNGQLGSPNAEELTPVQVSGVNDVVSIAAGENETVALKSDGSVLTWGANGSGQLGNGTVVDSSIPVNVLSGLSDGLILKDAVAVAAGKDAFMAALKADGTVWTWGNNWNGELGNGTTLNSVIPVRVDKISGITAIAAGVDHMVALRADGRVWTWGYNGDGELGINSTTDSSTPVLVQNLEGVVEIAAGAYHTLALKSDGTVWAWGANWVGGLGNGTSTDQHVPVHVSNLSDVIAVEASNYSSFALKKDGTVWAWGENSNGELGNGTFEDSTSPVQVDKLFGINLIGSGDYHAFAAHMSTNGDSTAPVSNITTPTGGSVTGGTYVVSGTSSDEVTGSGLAYVEVSTDGGVIWSLAHDTSADGSWSTWSYPWTLSANNTYTLTCRAKDKAGNVEVPGTGITVTAEIDSIPPSSNIIGPANSSTLNGVGYNIAGTAGDVGSGVSVVEISLDGTNWIAATDTSGNCSWTSWSYYWTFPANGGSFTIQSRATDLAGNVETLSAGVTVNVNNTGFYTWNSAAYNWLEIGDDPQNLSSISGDDNYGAADLGFMFNYCGNISSKILLSTNGLAGFSHAGMRDYGYSIPDPSAPNNIIAPFWQYMVVDGGAHIYTKTIGTAPNRTFVAEWKNLRNYDGTDYNQTFEMLLYEGSNKVVFQYQTINDTGNATVGLENPDGTLGVQYEYQNANITSGTAIEFNISSVDTTPPTVQITSPQDGFLAGAHNTISGTDDDGTGSGVKIVNVSVDGNSLGAAALTGNSWSISWSPATEGTHTISVVATDNAGNSSVPVTISGTIDNTAPSSTITAPTNDATLTEASYTITGSADDGTGSGVQKVEVSTNGGASWNLATGTDSWSYSWNIGSPGSHRILSKATDYAGNVEVYGSGVTVNVSAIGNPELQHYNWNAILSRGDCTACHAAVNTFLAPGFRNDNAFCFSCHNAAGVSHDKGLYGYNHSTMVNATTGGAKMPTYGSITSGEFNNQPFSRLNAGKVVCVTCHNTMRKSEDMGRTWEYTTTSDNLTYTMQNGGWAGYKNLVPKVYRDTSLWAGPTYSKTKKGYLVDPSEYNYNEDKGTVTFLASQDLTNYIYVSLDYPYLRASNAGNTLCADCHVQQTHRGDNCQTCHAAHNTGNIKGIRESLRAPNRTSVTVKFLRYTGTNSFADGDLNYDGICEVCHTQTKYYRRNGLGFANHSSGVNQNGKDCISCHSHATGFAK